MTRTFFLMMAASAFALPVAAQDDAVLADIPPGVLIFDVDPAEAVPVSEGAPVVEAVPVATSAPASTRSSTEPVVTFDVLFMDDRLFQPIPELAEAIQADDRVRPAPKLDPVSGRLRDTPGWTGRTDGPASIGCFPEGACAVLNLQ